MVIKFNEFLSENIENILKPKSKDEVSTSFKDIIEHMKLDKDNLFSNILDMNSYIEIVAGKSKINLVKAYIKYFLTNDELIDIITDGITGILSDDDIDDKIKLILNGINIVNNLKDFIIKLIDKKIIDIFDFKFLTNIVEMTRLSGYDGTLSEKLDRIYNMVEKLLENNDY